MMKNGEAFNRATYSFANNFFSARMIQILVLVGGKFTDIHTDGRTHGRRERARIDVSSLDAIRARFRNSLDDGTGILLDLFRLERSLAHDDVNIRGQIGRASCRERV